MKNNRMVEWFKRNVNYFKNKYILTTLIFVFYGLFLDEDDIFFIVSQRIKLSKLEKDKVEMEHKLAQTKYTLKKLKYTAALETYAREKKLFKKDNEDIFIITYK